HPLGVFLANHNQDTGLHFWDLERWKREISDTRRMGAKAIWYLPFNSGNARVETLRTWRHIGCCSVKYPVLSRRQDLKWAYTWGSMTYSQKPGMSTRSGGQPAEIIPWRKLRSVLRSQKPTKKCFVFARGCLRDCHKSIMS